MQVLRGKYNFAKVMIDQIDEAPMAYKPKEMILEAIKDTVEVVDFLKPIYNFKAAEKPAGHRTHRSEEVINE